MTLEAPPYPPVPVERAETRPLRIVTRDPRGWRVALVVGLGVLAVVIAGGFLWVVVTAAQSW